MDLETVNGKLQPYLNLNDFEFTTAFPWVLYPELASFTRDLLVILW